MGRNKAWLRLRDPGGPTLIETLLALVEPDFHPVRILAGEAPIETYASLGVPVETDLRPGCGPLGGIHTALARAQEDAVLVLACDLPFLDRGFLRELQGLLAGHDAVVPRPGGLPLPVCAFYSKRCLPVVEARLHRGKLKAAAALEDLSVRWVEDPELARLDPSGTALFNLNTPEDVQRARSLVR